MTRAAEANIDLDALQHNLRKVRHAAAGRRIMADGYGLGILTVARALHDADAFAGACFDDAMTLRSAGIVQPIVLLEGFFSAEEIPLLPSHDLISVIHHPHQLALLEPRPAT